MADLLVVGSGASGVHFTLTALQRGHRVTMLDVGHPRPEIPAPDTAFPDLPEALDDPAAWFLGPDGEQVVYPGDASSYYGHPPSKAYVFQTVPNVPTRSEAMVPLFTFARGGFAEAWTAGCYPFSPADLAGMPVTSDDLRPHYQEVARRIGIGGVEDDLAPFLPFEAEYLPPLPLDPHSAHLVAGYARRRAVLHRQHRFFLGRSRVATLTTDRDGRQACSQLGRCLWGCPSRSIYTPSQTLEQCDTFPGFRYHPGLLVRRFDYDGDGRIGRVLAQPVDGGPPSSFTGDAVILAAGALGSSRIVLESMAHRTGTAPRLPGLMDNRQIHMPFLTPGMLGTAPMLAAYQFHHLAFAVARDPETDHVHGQITTLKAASVHPILAGIPGDLRSALRLFQGVRSSLGIANVNLHDTRRSTSYLTLDPTGDGAPCLVVHYDPDPGEPARMAAATRDVRRALRRMGSWVLPGLVRVLPMGASVHYAGTLPMTAEPTPLAVDPSCRSWDFPNLHVVDGAVLPRLPAKNLTFTLMANAVRVAMTAF